MCGIFGLVYNKYNKNQLKSISRKLFLLSETRGKEASGFAFLHGSNTDVFKMPLPSGVLVKTKVFKEIFDEYHEEGIFIGHSRLVTNGYETDNINNQPFIKNDIVGIHNGIVVNVEQLWQKNVSITKTTKLDSEIFPALFDLYLKEGLSLAEATKKIFDEIRGMSNIAMLFPNLGNLLLATNNGSLYYFKNEELFVFASESYILKKIIEDIRINIDKENIFHVTPNKSILVNIENISTSTVSFNEDKLNFNNENRRKINSKIKEIPCNLSPGKIYINTSLNNDKANVPEEFKEHYIQYNEKIGSLKRCQKCLLPETFPFIEFDENGVCNKCNSYIKKEVYGIEALKEKVAPFRKSNGKPDCIVAFSGGRDSSYSLHIVKKELGLTPLAYSYDWGMLTDLGRRNQALMCGKLGVEHILISADIRKKRENIRKNVLAWLNKPHLGTVPLFMAGDKQYFHYASKLQENYNIPLLIMGENHFEKTGFKIEFSGARQEQKGLMSYNMSMLNKFKMLGFYSKEFILNPKYINSSLIDSMWAYFAYYGSSHDYINLFDYISWDEKEINSVLLKEYNWETDPGYNSTWRIGDGTASFYNYIYYIVAGFSENDTFRSNQIRAGVISREEALEISEMENTPRWDSINWYANTIGVDFIETIRTINRIPKKY